MEGFIATANLNTPLGAVTAAAGEDGLCFLAFSDRAGLADEVKKLGRDLDAEVRPGPSPWFEALETQLAEYFSLSRRAFGIPLLYTGTPFQRAVWRELEAIPYGRTISYQEEALALGKPGSARAVAGANARNRLMILIPCHRVIGTDGSLSGYADGPERKKRLIELEAVGLAAKG
jgi:AraC family transcriptional regulator, regulatory protein of adaptative response / methylated-DNA-[protein]-cysteine methyltransferase